MHALYQFACGPLAWAAFGLFSGGCLYRLWQLLRLARRNERSIFSYFTAEIADNTETNHKSRCFSKLQTSFNEVI